MNLFNKSFFVAILCIATLKAARIEDNAADFIRNKNLPVLCTEQNIFQIQSKTDLGGWTCGFFTLENARNLTASLGLGPACDIKQACASYVNKKGINPHNAINNSQLTSLADDVLHVQNFYPLHIDKKGMVALMPEEISHSVMKATDIASLSTNVQANKKKISVHVNAPFETSQDEINTSIQNAITSDLQERLVNLNLILAQQHTGILNFGCMLNPEEEHVMLISIVQFSPYNRALFVLDNVNKPYTESPTRSQFVHTLQTIFCA